MEYILQNTDIFDDEIGTKFNDAIKADKENYDKEKLYRFTVSFHVNLLKDPRFETFYIPEPPYKRKKVTREDKIGDVMMFQLDKLEEILKENQIESDSLTIQGDNLEIENIIKIEISEDTSEQKFISKGKNRRRERGISHLIVPSRPGTQKHISQLYTDRVVELYRKFLKDPIGDKKRISDILGINETEDEVKLIMAFGEQYGDLWLTTTDKEKKLLDQLKNRTLSVLYKYADEDQKAEAREIFKKENIQIDLNE